MSARTLLLLRRKQLRGRHLLPLSYISHTVSSHLHQIHEQFSVFANPTPNYRSRHFGGAASRPALPFCSVTLRHLSTAAKSKGITGKRETPLFLSESDQEEGANEWSEDEEDKNYEPEIDDGRAGGGVALENCRWGERALSIAREVLLQFGDDMILFAFRTTRRGYVFVRLDKLPNKYGCPTPEEMESYHRIYLKRLEEVGALGEIPDDLGLEVSSPGGDRLLRVPNDLDRFKDMAMNLTYIENAEAKSPEKKGVFFLDSIKTESQSCIWRLADVKENRDPLVKRKPLNRKQRDWRLELPYAVCKRVTIYLDCK